ncbi:uncharacterized protein LOC106053460 isoform X3 [Biomphalaria glabrata]|uniref:Uncharacterized protein LOC106053460 isoform X3 n=1 Tax=Biomphalaria glabrata TaxID=6526 RepID=A0A9W3BBD2_BIOGL|nr:uncharacterized protein LOC106053460 isoform X3 [Biomphalaria glabrata]
MSLFNMTSVKTLADLQLLIESLKDKQFCNAFVYHLFLNSGKKAQQTGAHLIDLAQKQDCNLNSVKIKIARLNNQMKVYKSTITKNWNIIVNFLAQEFRFPVAKQKHDPVRPKMPPPPFSPLETRAVTCCLSCQHQRLTNSNLKASNSKLKQSLYQERKEKNEIRKTYEVRKVNQKLKRNTSRISNYKLKTQGLRAKIISLERSLKRSHIKCKHLGQKNMENEKKIDYLTMEVCKLKQSKEMYKQLLLEKSLLIENLQEKVVQ